jgi:hypothetical protein
MSTILLRSKTKIKFSPWLSPIESKRFFTFFPHTTPPPPPKKEEERKTKQNDKDDRNKGHTPASLLLMLSFEFRHNVIILLSSTIAGRDPRSYVCRDNDGRHGSNEERANETHG